MTQTSNLEKGLKLHAFDPAQPPKVTVIPPDEVPDETWSVEQLLDYGRRALHEGEECDTLVVPLARRSVVARFGAGHAYSILRSRLKSLGKWCNFQEEHELPRTSVWEVVEVYEAATRDGLKEDDLVDRYSSWTGILLAYGLTKPRKNKIGGYDTEHLGAPKENDDDAQGGDGAQDDEDADDEDWDWDDEEVDDDAVEGESDDESPAPEPEDTTEVVIPPVTDDQICAADSFVNSVGGRVHAVRVLMARSVSGGDKDAVKDTLAEVVRAASAVLTPSEIVEIVIVSTARGKGIKVVTV